VHTGDCFCDAHHNTDWTYQVIQGEKLGIGTQKYEFLTTKLKNENVYPDKARSN